MFYMQTIGYFVKLTTEEGRPPVVFVLSENSATVLLFPFVNNSDNGVVECVQLPDYPIWLPSPDVQFILSKYMLL